MKVQKANISKILKSSVIDGPGNRMVIFFQGCNLNCKYCHNAHTIGLCNLCGICIENCPVQALKIENRQITVDNNKCINCDKCIENCPKNSSPFYTQMSSDEIIDEIEKVKEFISGITISGGECMLQVEFLKELFSKIRNSKDLNTLSIFIDSNGNIYEKNWDLVLDDINGVMLDLKAFSEKVHKKITGFSNDRIVNSIKYIDAHKKLEGIRIVMVKNHNDDKEEILKMGEFLKTVSKNVNIFLIKMRKYGIRKEYQDLDEFSDVDMKNIKEDLEKISMREIMII